MKDKHEISRQEWAEDTEEHFLGECTQSWKAPINFVMSTLLFTGISVAPTGLISTKFVTGNFYENLPRNSTVG